MRQRHLRRYWRKRIEEDPYKALFGASEDMLRGRGLDAYIQQQKEMHKKSIEWVEKMVPKWVLEDMGVRSKDAPESKEPTRPKDEKTYPKKVNIESEQNVGMYDRANAHSALLSESTQFERKLRHGGVDSPSDSRRPRERPTTPLSTQSALQEDVAQELRKTSHDSLQPLQEDSRSTSANPSLDTVIEPASVDERTSNLRKKAHVHEASFIDEFLADKTPSDPTANSAENTNIDSWRQTVLDRRASLNYSPKQRRKTDISIVDVNAKYSARPGLKDTAEPFTRDTARTDRGLSSERNSGSIGKDRITSQNQSGSVILDFRGAPSARVGMKEVQEYPNNLDETAVEEKPAAPLADTVEIADEKKPAPPSEGYLPRLSVDDWLVTRPKGSNKPKDASSGIVIKNADDLNFGQSKSERPIFPRRSTSTILEQLPKDDIDFLTADEVRASMGRTKKENEDKSATREELEYEYQKKVPELDAMLETQVVNGQYVRRKTSELAQAEGAKSVEAQPAITTPTERSDEKPVSVLETSLDFMSRWLHTGGNVFAQHFWQDPIQLAAGQLSGADEEFYKGVGIGVVKGRRAFAIIKDELVDDIPASQKLVSRLNNDELKASAGAIQLYRDLPSALKDSSDEAVFKAAAHARVAKLRQALLDTDKQFKEACEQIDGMGTVPKPGFMLQKRLRFAADVLRKNAKLTRMAIFGLQGRIEVATGSDGLVFRELLHRLLTLQDTQLALSRLVARAMRVMGVEPNTDEVPSLKKEESTTIPDHPTEPQTSVPAAAVGNSAEPVDDTAMNKKLEEEVSHLKDAMIGLSDDGYKHPPRKSFRKSFEEPNPLAHSLFRPFSLQLESLGKESDADERGVLSAAKKEKEDRELVKEVRKAYEDVYGPITVDHVQVATDKERLASPEKLGLAPEADALQKEGSIQMLKEDNISSAVTSQVLETEEILKKDETEGVLPSGQPEHEPTTSTSPLADEEELAYNASTETYVPISYKTLIYNAQTDKLSITTSPVPHPAPPIVPMPLHEALATLSHPSKFIEHLPGAFHVISAKPDVLAVRTASPFSATAEKNVTTSLGEGSLERPLDTDEADSWKRINPVDGTTTLSPTGFEGVGSDLERELEFQERRRKAQEYNVAREDDEASKQHGKTTREKRKNKGRVGFGGVVKTAIWASALCYVVGVVAEVIKVPI